MYKFFVKYIHFIITITFSFYFLVTLSKVPYKNIEVLSSLLLVLPLYLLSVNKLILQYVNENKISLINIFKSTFFLFIPLKFMAYVNTQEANNFIVSNSDFSTNLNNVFFTLFVVLVSFLSLNLGHSIARYKTTQKSIELVQLKNNKVPILILSLSTLAIIYIQLKGFSGYNSDIKYTEGFYSFIKAIIGAFNPIFLCFSSYVVVTKRVKYNYKLLFYFLLTTQVANGLFSGMKETAIIPILIYFVFYLKSGKTISKATMIIGLFSLIILYPLNNNYRSMLNSGHFDNYSSYQVYGLALSNVIETNSFLELYGTSVKQYSSRGDMFTYLNHSIQNKNNWTYFKNMNRYLLMPIYPFIPRFLWESKPRSDEGREYYNIITGRKTNSVTVSSIGWSYLEGGIIPVILIFMFLGYFLNIFNNNNNNGLKSLTIWVIVLLLVIKPEWDPFFAITGFIQSLILLNILLKLLTIKSRKPHENLLCL